MTGKSCNPHSTEVLELVQAMMEDRLKPQGAAKLDDLLRENETARWIYAQYMNLYAGLAWDRTLRKDEQFLNIDIGAHELLRERAICANSGTPAPDDEAVEQPGIPQNVLPSLSSAWPSKYFASDGWALPYMVATVFMCLLLLGFWAYKLPSDRGSSIASSDNSRRSTTSGEESIHDRPAPVFVGRVTGIAGAKWSDDPDYVAPIGYRVALGRQYKLKSGLMEITYDSGAKVILEGPCSYEIESARGGYLALGKLVAKVGAGGEGRGAGEVASGQRPVASVKDEGGRMKDEASLATSHQPLATVSNPKSLIPNPLFTVRTPTAVVTDLGTEFGVEVDQRGMTDAFVFVGSVRLAAIGAEGDEAAVLKAGHAGRVERGARRVVVGDDGEGENTVQFVRSMPPPKSVRESEAYAELVLSLNPAVYYRMERPKKGVEAKKGTVPFGAKHPQGRSGQRGLSPFPPERVVLDSAGGGHHGELRLGNDYGGSPYRRGRFGDALWLRGPEAGDHVIVPDYPKTTDNQLTVSAWVYATGRPKWGMIAANWGHPQDGNHLTGQFMLGLFGKDGDLSGRVTRHDGQYVEAREGAARPFPLFVWQHAALAVDGAALRLYRNGEEVASIPCDGVILPSPLTSMAIGCKTDNTGLKAASGESGNAYSWQREFFWQGRIDELAVFNHALSAKTIRRLSVVLPAPFSREGDRIMEQ